MKGFERVNYRSRLDSLIARRAAPVQLKATTSRYSFSREHDYDTYTASPLYEVYNRLPRDESAVRYLVGAMARLDPRYTEITYVEGDRIRNQLAKSLKAASAECEFEYQGSVTSDTHIKSYSDIDLLVITSLFWSLESPQKPTHPYDGNPVDDLKDIRTRTGETLRKEFPAATLDESGSKSICISGGSLRRKIDVVPANWFHTNRYAETGEKRFRGIQILDLSTGQRVTNSPFLHNHLIHERDAATHGGLRKVIRLMKTLKYDHGSISLSSYDIASIGYNMPEDELSTSAGGEVVLLTRLKRYLDNVATNTALRQGMSTPDESRRVFSNGHATLESLQMLQSEVNELLVAVSSDLKATFGNLIEARLSY